MLPTNLGIFVMFSKFDFIKKIYIYLGIKLILIVVSVAEPMIEMINEA